VGDFAEEDFVAKRVKKEAAAGETKPETGKEGKTGDKPAAKPEAKPAKP
jgi:hypothetical protein